VPADAAFSALPARGATLGRVETRF